MIRLGRVRMKKGLTVDGGSVQVRRQHGPDLLDVVDVLALPGKGFYR